MKNWKNFTAISCLLMFILGYQYVDAQQDIAQEVYAIFEKSCLGCHGESGAYKDSLLIDRAALIDTQVVLPGDPENSEFYKRLLGPTDRGPQMPLNLPPLSSETIQTIAQWITAGAPDWNVQRDINFITTDTILGTIQTHLESLDAFDRPSARYFTLTHLYNAGESPQTLNDYRIALSKLINSLSWKLEITNPTPIDTAKTIFYIDLRHYEWRTRTDVWALIEQTYPYNIAFDAETQAGLLEKLTQLQTETGSTVPFVHADWFLATASLPPLYHNILDLPQTDRALETQLEVNVESNIRNAPGINVWRAGFNDSGVSTNNRVVERHASRDGAYWKSYDFAGSTGSQNIFTHPLDFTHDGGEIIFNLPNGLQAYFLVDANGTRLNEAPIDIVSNPAASDPTVRNGLSCIGCHDQGMKKFTDSVRAAIEQNQNPPYNREHALRLYPEQSKLNELLQKDTQRFQQALEKIGGPFTDDESRQQFFKRHENEPVQRFHEVFQGPLDASHAAAAIGLETTVFLTQISEKQSLKNLGLQTLIDENGTVKRDAWTSNFHDVISALNTPDSDLPPVVERPDRIPGAGVFIPDVNLRAAIEEALGKVDNEVITVEDIESLTELKVPGLGIRDLTGLEAVTNLRELSIRDNQISDLSPIAGLTKLRGLWIINNPISDISHVKGLTNLIELVLDDTHVSNLSPIAGLVNLKVLGTSTPLINDLSPLKELKNLTNFWFHRTQVSDLSPLAGLTNLENIAANQGAIFLAIRRIEEDTELVINNAEQGKISDLSPLAGLVNLKSIWFWGNPITDLSPLSGLTKLERLDICGGTILDLKPLVDLTNLRGLFLAANGISDILPLAELTGLNRLDIRSNNISDISPLAGLTHLNYLRLNNNNISDFAPLDAIRQNITLIWHDNPGFPKGGPKIEGPWLWVVLPDADLESGMDLLAEASDGRVTESEIATHGATVGESVGSDIWTSHKLPHTGRVEDMLEPPIPDGIIYGSLSVYSPRQQETTLWVGSRHELKVWFNGSLIHQHGLYDRNGKDYTDFYPATLQPGRNVLLVAFSSNANGFFGFEPGTEYTVISPSDVYIPDPNLRAAIAEVLGKEDADNFLFTLAEMTTLTTLNASARDIKDLTGIEFAMNLTELRIGWNPIEDLSPLTKLTKMREIYFHDTQVSDLSPLASLHNLEVINAAHTRISNLDPLAGLKNLKKLDTVHSDISDLSPLEGLTNLTRLYLYDCQATDLSPLKSLTNLRWLGLNHSDHISDFSPMSILTELRHLDLSDTGISDLTPLAGLVNLETLILNANRIVDVSPLASLRNLKNLQLHENNISDLSPLAGIRETIEVFTWFGNPAFPQGGPNIEGPWLWLTLPVKIDKDVDYLAKVSNNKFTEQQIATLGASEGTVIGNRAWSVGMLESYQPNPKNFKDNKTNLKRLLDSQNTIEPNIYGQTFVVYGSMTLYSPRIQQTKIFIGASEGQKIYLNGKLVHQDYKDYSHGAHNVGYRTFFPVTLQKGKNVLLVRLDNLKAHYDLWSLFFGFELDTEYMVLTPGVGFSFSVIEKDFLAGDTFTLNLNAENITDLAGWEGDISFDPNALEAVEVTEGDFLKTDNATTFFQGGTIDNTTGKITDINIARITKGGISGSGTLLFVKFRAKVGGDTYITLENFEFGSSSGDIIPAVPPNITITVGEYPAWDVNQDGRVSILDLILVAQDLGSGTPANLRTDVNRDGTINIQDLIIVAQHIGETIDDSAAPAIFATDNKELTPAMVQAWIEQAQLEDDGSITFQQGIENLQKLLASLLPEKTALLANYPNPFNPETWVPYHLAKPAEVTLTIYTSNGIVVRTLSLGHQNAGIYQNRSRAAYWDGKNSVGELVASGIYFYTLTAGDFTATRKMLIRK